MNHYEEFKNNHFISNKKRDSLLVIIIRDCNSFNEVEIDLIDIEKEIAVFCSDNCKSCYKKSVNDNLNWSNFCDKSNFRCSDECEIINKINGYFGYKLISQIKLETFSFKNKKTKNKNISTKLSEDFEKKIKEIKNEKIRNSLFSLLKTIKND